MPRVNYYASECQEMVVYAVDKRLESGLYGTMLSGDLEFRERARRKPSMKTSVVAPSRPFAAFEPSFEWRCTLKRA